MKNRKTIVQPQVPAPLASSAEAKLREALTDVVENWSHLSDLSSGCQSDDQRRAWENARAALAAADDAGEKAGITQAARSDASPNLTDRACATMDAAIAELLRLKSLNAELREGITEAMAADEALVDATEYELEPNPTAISKAQRRVDASWKKLRSLLSRTT